MAYAQQTWADGSAGGTPINATRLNHMEAGIGAAALATDLAAVAASVSQASTTARGTVELATVAEDQTGTDATRASTPAGTKAAIDQRIDNDFGLGSGSTTNAPSQAAVKDYVDSGLAEAVLATQVMTALQAVAPGVPQLVACNSAGTAYPTYTAYSDATRRWIFVGPATPPATAAPIYGATWLVPA